MYFYIFINELKYLSQKFLKIIKMSKYALKTEKYKLSY